MIPEAHRALAEAAMQQGWSLSWRTASGLCSYVAACTILCAILSTPWGPMLAMMCKIRV